MIKNGEMVFAGYNFRRLFKVEDVDRPLIAEVDSQLKERDGIDGAQFLSSSLKSKEIEVSIRMVRPFEKILGLNGGFEKARRLIASKLFYPEPQKLVLYDAPDIYDMAVLSGDFDVKKFVYTRTATLNFVCPSPASYGASRSKSSDGGDMLIKVGGNYKTAPTIEIKCSGNFSLLIDDREFNLYESIGRTGTIVIDGTERLVTYNGSTIRYSIFSDIPVWEPGGHEIYCPYPFTVRWVERWR